MARPDHSLPERRDGSAPAAISRREAIGAAGTTLAAALAGCAGGTDRRPDERILFEATIEVEPGNIDDYGFELADDQFVTVGATLTDESLEVKRDGPAVDVVVMTPGQYRDFQSEGSFEYVGGLSMPDVVAGQVSATLAAGEYRIVVDHSALGVGEPDDTGTPAVVDLEVTAGPGGRRTTAGVRP